MNLIIFITLLGLALVFIGNKTCVDPVFIKTSCLIENEMTFSRKFIVFNNGEQKGFHKYEYIHNVTIIVNKFGKITYQYTEISLEYYHALRPLSNRKQCYIINYNTNDILKKENVLYYEPASCKEKLGIGMFAIIFISVFISCVIHFIKNGY